LEGQEPVVRARVISDAPRLDVSDRLSAADVDLIEEGLRIPIGETAVEEGEIETGKQTTNPATNPPAVSIPVWAYLISWYFVVKDKWSGVSRLWGAVKRGFFKASTLLSLAAVLVTGTTLGLLVLTATGAIWSIGFLTLVTNPIAMISVGLCYGANVARLVWQERKFRSLTPKGAVSVALLGARQAKDFLMRPSIVALVTTYGLFLSVYFFFVLMKARRHQFVREGIGMGSAASVMAGWFVQCGLIAATVTGLSEGARAFNQYVNTFKNVEYVVKHFEPKRVTLTKRVLTLVLWHGQGFDVFFGDDVIARTKYADVELAKVPKDEELADYFLKHPVVASSWVTFMKKQGRLPDTWFDDGKVSLGGSVDLGTFPSAGPTQPGKPVLVAEDIADLLKKEVKSCHCACVVAKELPDEVDIMARVTDFFKNHWKGLVTVGLIMVVGTAVIFARSQPNIPVIEIGPEEIEPKFPLLKEAKEKGENSNKAKNKGPAKKRPGFRHRPRPRIRLSEADYSAFRKACENKDYELAAKLGGYADVNEFMDMLVTTHSQNAELEEQELRETKKMAERLIKQDRIDDVEVEYLEKSKLGKTDEQLEHEEREERHKRPKHHNPKRGETRGEWDDEGKTSALSGGEGEKMDKVIVPLKPVQQIVAAGDAGGKTTDVKTFVFMGIPLFWWTRERSTELFQTDRTVMMVKARQAKQEREAAAIASRFKKEAKVPDGGVRTFVYTPNHASVFPVVDESGSKVGLITKVSVTENGLKKVMYVTDYHILTDYGKVYAVVLKQSAKGAGGNLLWTQEKTVPLRIEDGAHSPEHDLSLLKDLGLSGPALILGDGGYELSDVNVIGWYESVMPINSEQRLVWQAEMSCHEFFEISGENIYHKAFTAPGWCGAPLFSTKNPNFCFGIHKGACGPVNVATYLGKGVPDAGVTASDGAPLLLPTVEAIQYVKHGHSGYEMIKPCPCEGEYKFLKPVGNIGMMRLKLDDGAPNMVVECDYAARFVSKDSPIRECCKDYAVVLPRKLNVGVAISKWEVERVDEYKKDPSWSLIHQILRSKLAWPLTVAPNLEDGFKMVTATSVGWALRQKGFSKKGQVLLRPNFIDFILSFKRHIPIGTVAPKTEMLELMEILNNKIRVFVIPDMILLFWQLALYSSQNERLKKCGWIAYGVSYQNGGFDGMMSRLSAIEEFFAGLEWDISRWDKRLPLMRLIYELRNECALLVREDAQKLVREAREWATKHTVESLILLPNGDIVFKDIGNDSGSGNTTPDNCIGHLAVVVCMLVWAFEAKFGKHPSPEEVEANMFCLYGDDALGAINEKFSFLLNQAWVADRLKKAFGFELKRLVGQPAMEGLSFLGAVARIERNVWIPEYNYKRICASVMYDLGRKKPDATLTKLLSVLYLSYCHAGLFEEIRKLYVEVLNVVPSSSVSDSLKGWIPTREVVGRMWRGEEGGSNFYFLQLSADMTEEGTKFLVEGMHGKQIKAIKDQTERIRSFRKGYGGQNQSPGKRTFTPQGGGSGDGSRNPKTFSGGGVPDKGFVKKGGSAGGSAKSGELYRLGPKNSGVVHSDSWAPDRRVTLKEAAAHSRKLMAISGVHIFKSKEEAKLYAEKMKTVTPQLLEALAQKKEAHAQVHAAKAAYADKLMTSKLGAPARIHDKIVRAQAYLEKTSEALKKLEEGISHPIPVINSFRLDSQMFHEEEKVEKSDDGVIVQGSEFLSSVVSGVGGSGVPIFCHPLSPVAFGGGRLGAFADLYDMYQWTELIFEWIPTAGSDHGGSVVAFCDPDIMADASNAETGDAALRDATSRPGSEMNQIFLRTAYGVNFPQQAVFYTANTDSPNLMFSGLFSMIKVGAMATQSITDAIGTIIVHYKIKFLQASSLRSTTFMNVYPASGTVLWFGFNQTINQSFYVGAAAWEGTFGLLPLGCIGVCTVASFVDVTTPASWRSLRAGESKYAVTVAIGTRLWFRKTPDNNSLLFFPSAGTAIEGHNAATDPGDTSDVLTNSATNVIIVGTSISFYDVKIWALPDSTQ